MTEAPNVPTLIIEGGPLDGTSMQISEGATLIVGSGRLAHFRVDHPMIELAHVKVIWDEYGISMVDNGSRYGTWVNGEQVETAGLLDGDVIAFAAPNAPEDPPQVRIRIPEGSVAPPPPPDPNEPPVQAAEAGPAQAPPAEEGAAAPEMPLPSLDSFPAPPAAPRRKALHGRKRGPTIPITGILLATGGLAILAVAGFVIRGMLGGGPSVDSVEPGQSPAGHGITINGSGFDPDANSNVVYFGDRGVPASSVTEGSLKVSVPGSVPSGRLQVSVHTSSGRSNSVPFTVLTSLSAVALEPPGARPGDEVVLRGHGLGEEGLALTVGGQPATVLEATDEAVRFQVPALEGETGSKHAVVATLSGRSTSPMDMVLGRLPLVSGFEPDRATAGEIVRLRGLGFAPRPSLNEVTFDGVPALVARASPEELTVFAPAPARPQPRTLARVVVRAGESTSEPATFPLLRLLSGSFVLRFYPAAGPPGVGPAQGFVANEIAPVLLLAHKDGREALATRLLRVSKALNGVVDRARTGADVRFVAVEQPSIGVGVSGSAEVVLEVTAQDAAAYSAPPGVPPRGGPPTPVELARHWAAVLNDTLVICTSRESPSQVGAALAESGRAFTALRSALPWQYGTGVGNDQVARIPEQLRRTLQEAALRVP